MIRELLKIDVNYSIEILEKFLQENDSFVIYGLTGDIRRLIDWANSNTKEIRFIVLKEGQDIPNEDIPFEIINEENFTFDGTKVIFTETDNKVLAKIVDANKLEAFKDYIVDYQCYLYKRDDLKKAVGKEFYEYLKVHINEFEHVYNVLEDEYSKNAFVEILKFRLQYLDIMLLKESIYPLPKDVFDVKNTSIKKKESIFGDLFGDIPFKQFIKPLSENVYTYGDFISCENKKVIIDAGGASGDTAGVFSLKQPNSSIYSFEPIDKYYEQIQDISTIFPNVTPVKAGVSKETKEAKFHKVGLYQFSLNNNGSNDSNIEKGNVYSIDDFVKLNSLDVVDFIKMDIEGAEMPALIGSRKTIEQFKPDLAICIYHSEQDLWEIIKWINENYPFYKIYVDHELKKNIAGTICYATALDNEKQQLSSIRDNFYKLQLEEILKNEAQYLNEMSKDADVLFYLAFTKKYLGIKNYREDIKKYVQNSKYNSKLNYLVALLEVLKEENKYEETLKLLSRQKLVNYLDVRFINYYIEYKSREYFTKGEYENVLSFDFVDNSTVTFYRGRANKELGNVNEAVALLENFISQTTSLKENETGLVISAYFHLGELYMQLEKLNESENCFSIALAKSNNGHSAAMGYLDKIKKMKEDVEYEHKI